MINRLNLSIRYKLSINFITIFFCFFMTTYINWNWLFNKYKHYSKVKSSYFQRTWITQHPIELKRKSEKVDGPPQKQISLKTSLKGMAKIGKKYNSIWKQELSVKSDRMPRSFLIKSERKRLKSTKGKPNWLRPSILFKKRNDFLRKNKKKDMIKSKLTLKKSRDKKKKWIKFNQFNWRTV